MMITALDKDLAALGVITNDTDVESQVGRFETLAGPVTVTYVR